MEKSRGIFFLSWPEVFQDGVEAVGGKGWNLARLDRYGFYIPAGGVLTARAYQIFAEENDLLEDMAEITQSVNIDNIGEKKIEQKLLLIREKIKAGQIPSKIRDELESGLKGMGLLGEPVAVRSSATAEDPAQASFAGIHSSFLNVTGWESILEAVKDCYASLWTPRSVAYRRKLSLADQDVLPAVVIMKMVEARAAGVAFTCDPQTGREDLFVINANFGLGESVVSGAIEPDTYYLDSSAYFALPRLKAKKTGAKQGMTRTCAGGGTCFVPGGDMASQQVLPDGNIEKLGLLLARVFESLGEGEEHQDVEWAFDGRDFVLLQARPVTALPCYTFDALKNKVQIWSNGNYRDAVPMVISPLQRRVMKDSIDTIQYTSLSEPGYPVPEGFQFSRLVKGRLYCNVSALQWAYYDCSGMLSKDFNPGWGGHQPVIEIEDTDPYKGEIGLERQRRGMKGASLIMEAAANASGTFAEVARSVESLTGSENDQQTNRGTFSNRGTFLLFGPTEGRSYCWLF